MGHIPELDWNVIPYRTFDIPYGRDHLKIHDMGYIPFETQYLKLIYYGFDVSVNRAKPVHMYLRSIFLTDDRQTPSYALRSVLQAAHTRQRLFEDSTRCFTRSLTEPTALLNADYCFDYVKEVVKEAYKLKRLRNYQYIIGQAAMSSSLFMHINKGKLDLVITGESHRFATALNSSLKKKGTENGAHT